MRKKREWRSKDVRKVVEQENFENQMKKNLWNFQPVRILDLLSILGSIFTTLTFCSIDYWIAEYQGTEIIYRIAQAAIGIMTIAVVCGTAYLLYCKITCIRLVCNKIYMALKKGSEELSDQYHASSLYKHHRTLKTSVSIGCAVMIFAAVLIYYNWSETSYYASVREIYGIPTGIGDELSVEKLENRSFYWEIKDYPNQKRMVLTYHEAYGQMELMRRYSTVYQLDFFQPTAKVVYRYRTDKDKFRAYKQQDYFDAARGNDWRVVEEVSYYDNNGKLLMQLIENGNDKYKIVAYSSEDVPQLLNSTLLRTPETDSREQEQEYGIAVEKDITFGNDMEEQQIEVAYNASGLPQSRKLDGDFRNLYGVNGERYAYDKDNRLTALYYLDANGETICNNLGIMMVSFQYDNDGNMSSIRYFSDENGIERIEGFHDVFCENLFYDNDGNIEERRLLNRSESWCYDSNGVCVYRYEHSNGMLTQETFLAFDGGAKIRDKNLQSKTVEFHQEKRGKEREIVITLDAVATVPADIDDPVTIEETESDAMPSIGIENDIMLEAMAQPKESAAIEESYTGGKDSIYKLGLSDRKKADIEGKDGEETETIRKYETIHYLIGSDNQITKVLYQDGYGNLVLNEDGYAIKQLQYNRQQEVYEETYYDTYGYECFTDNGYKKIRRTDNDGKEKIEYLRADEELAFNYELGYSYICYEVFKQGRNTTVMKSYYDELSRPIQVKDKGYAKVEETYDENGHLIRTAYYNENGLAVCREDYGIAEIIREYGENGNLIREWYKNENGRLANRSDSGFAVLHREYKDGNLSMQYYEGYQNQTLRPVANKGTGVAYTRYTFENGHKQQEEYFDTDMEPVLRKDIGCAAQRWEYTDMGKIAALFFYGADGELALRKDMGCAVIRYEYDDFGRRTYSRYYDSNEKPVISTEYQCAGFRYNYDEEGNETDIYYLAKEPNAQDKFIVRRNLGFAYLHREYDDEGNVKTESYYDDIGNPTTRTTGGYASFENIYEKGKLKECRYYDIDGELVLRKDKGFAIVRYEYDNKGQMLSQEFYDTHDRRVISTEYLCAGMRYQYNAQGRQTDTWYIGLDGSRMVRSDLGYAHVRSEYDEMGNESRVFFFNTQGEPIVGKEGGYAYYEKKYENGNCIERRYYDVNGNLVMRNDKTYAIVKYKYDDYGQCIAELYYDDNGDALVSKQYLCAGMRYQYDEQRRKTDTWYIGLDGNLIIRSDYGYAQIHSEYDELGNEIRVSYFDTQGEPVGRKEGGYASFEKTYQNGHCVERRYYDTKGNLMLRNDEGYAIIRYEYDEYGKCIKEFYYDTEEKPVVNQKYHCAGFTYEYDVKGNRTDIRCFSAEEEPMMRRDEGYAHIQYAYDDMGNEIRVSYFDAGEKLVLIKGGGYASCEKKYENGQCVEQRYLDTAHQLILRNDEGYAIRQSKYNDYGQCILVVYRGTDKKPVINREYHCAGWKYAYDGNGRRTDTWYIGLNGQYMIRKDLGYAHVHSDYDKMGNEITASYEAYMSYEDYASYMSYEDYIPDEEYNDTKGYPVARKEGGYASVAKSYDKRGNCVERRYLDLYGDLKLRDDEGYAVIKMEYDDYGQIIAESYYGIYEQPVFNTEYHYAGRKFEYDERGNRVGTRYIGLDGAQMEQKDWGYAQIYSEYDEAGHEIKISYLNTEGEPGRWKTGGYGYCECTYEDGKAVEWRYYNTNGDLMLRWDEGYAIIQYEYDEFGQRIKESFYGIDGEPIISAKYHCAGMKYAFDEKGQQTDIWYIGLDGNIMKREDLGYAQIHSEYDNLGNKRKITYLDADGQHAISGPDGYASVEKKFANGNCIEERYLDENGNLTLRIDDGYAMVKYQYNALGQLTWISYYGTDEKPIFHSDFPCASIFYSYNERENNTHVWYYGLDGEPIDREDIGSALYRKEYDAYDHIIREEYLAHNPQYNGWLIQTDRKDTGYAAIESVYEGIHLIEKRYLDAGENLVAPSNIGYAVCQYEYNFMDQLTQVRYYDADMEPVHPAGKKGASIEYVYDASGNKIDEISYDVDGKQIE